MRSRHAPHVPHVPRRLGRTHRRALYLTGGLLWGSGAGWLAVHYLLRAAAADPSLPAPSEPLWLRVHGAATMIFLVLLGMLLPGHVRQGLRQHLNRATGLASLAVCAALALTGYGLYYLSSDVWRARASLVHWSLGLGSALVVMIHVALGRRLYRRRFKAARRRGHVFT